MNEEITTEIDISGEYKLSESKVVHVDFKNPNINTTTASPAVVIPAPVRRRSSLLGDIDWRLPWVLRLVAAIAVVGLSLLFF